MLSESQEKDRLFRKHLEERAWGRTPVWRRGAAFMIPMLVLLALIWFIPEAVWAGMLRDAPVMMFFSVAAIFVPIFVVIMVWAMRRDNADYKRHLTDLYAEYNLEPPVDK